MRELTTSTHRGDVRGIGRVYGAGRDLERTVTTHVFVICPNNSGSTFLKQALATCRATWNLPREGQWMLGYRGPRAGDDVALIWASTRELRDSLSDPGAYDWPRIRRAWYFQAQARHPRASVFVVKSPLYVLLVPELARRFRNPKFLFMVRNPYAVCEGICRFMARRMPVPDPGLPEKAARHVAACLEHQRRNVDTVGSRGVFFSYETMCSSPRQVAGRIETLVPELGDLNLKQRLPVKGLYDEMLSDMNGRQIDRLEPRQIAAFNAVFERNRGTLDHFGYGLMEK